jgi:thymidylate synthase
MKTYLDTLQQVLDQGTTKQDRTGTGTISLFGMQQRYDLGQGFPAVTTKQLAWRSVVSELLWFIEGSGDEKRLREILHGSAESEKTTIWSANATAPYWQPRARFAGDLGRVYGVQWRGWRQYQERKDMGPAHQGGTRVAADRHEVDQLLNLINGIKQDPHGRRHILSAWNPGELDAMALPPCHCFAQFYVNNNKLSCQMYQRSCDMFLGVPFNIASYSLLTHLIAQVCGLDVGEFVHVLGDAHIYLNHVEQVKEQLLREPLPAPQLLLNPDVKSIDDFTMADICLDGYQSHNAIAAPMSV